MEPPAFVYSLVFRQVTVLAFVSPPPLAPPKLKEAKKRERETDRQTHAQQNPHRGIPVAESEVPPPEPAEGSPAAPGAPPHSRPSPGLARPGCPPPRPRPGAAPNPLPAGERCPQQDGGAPPGASGGRAGLCGAVRGPRGARLHSPPSAPCPRDQVAAAAGAQQLARASGTSTSPPGPAGWLAARGRRRGAPPAAWGRRGGSGEGLPFVRVPLLSPPPAPPLPAACSRGRRPEALCVVGWGKGAERSAPPCPGPAGTASLEHL